MASTGAGGDTRALVFDPFAGISGDMVLGALVDVGLEGEWLRSFVAALDLGASVTVDRVDRSGIRCSRVRFELPHEHEHRHLDDVLAIVARSGVAAPVEERAAAVFRRIAEAEAAVHGVPVERVHFHEVGALDSILDVVCAAAGLAELGYDRFYTRPVAVGSGTVEMAHGRYPLPAPATARLLEGLPVRETGYPEECTTPTGAALLAELTRGRRAPAELVYGRTGYGAGTRDPQGRPNCLRVIEAAAAAERGRYTVVADVDDQAPEYLAAARDSLLEAGALDVTVTRVDMKKGRPGMRLEALVGEASLDAVTAAFFRGTTSIGVRYWPVERVVLERSEELLEWRGQRIRVKRVVLPDGRERRKPEFDDVMAAARATGLTPQEVRAEMEAAGPRNVPRTTEEKRIP
ncbi:MAG: nickel pincer cofactor biosynthesis protein LarC [Gemmatimonadota bacterium]